MDGSIFKIWLNNPVDIVFYVLDDSYNDYISNEHWMDFKINRLSELN